MPKTYSVLTQLTVYFSQVMIAINFHFFLMSAGTQEAWYISPLAWVFCALASFIILQFCVRHARSFVQVLSLSVACYVVTVLVMHTFFMQVPNTLSWLVALLFFGVTIAYACMPLLEPMKPTALLQSCELPAVGLAFLLLMDKSDSFTYPTQYVALSLLSLLISFLVLAIDKMDVGHADVRKRAATATTALCFVGMGAGSVCFALFATAGASRAVSSISQWISWVATSIFTALNNLMLWLATLIPASDADPTVLEAIEQVTTELASDSAITLDYELLATVFLMLIGIALIAVIGWLLFAFGREKIPEKPVSAVYQRPKVNSKRAKFWRNLWLFCKRKWQALSFALRILHKRNTPKGAVLLLAKLGKSRGIAKQDGESYQQYLTRLYHVCYALDQNRAQLLLQLSRIVDQTLYAPSPCAQTLSHKEYRQLRRLVLQVPKGKKIS